MWNRALRICCYIILGIFLFGILLPLSANGNFQIGSMELEHLQTFQDLGRIIDVAWSFDGKYLASANSRGEISIWNSENWNIVTTFSCEENFGQGLAWSPDQLVLAIGCSGFDLATVENINDLALVKFGTSGQSLAWSPNGNRIAIPQQDNRIAILDTSFVPLFTLGEAVDESSIDGGGATYINFSWSPSGKYLSAISLGQVIGITIWDVETQAKIEYFQSASGITWLSDGNSFVLTVEDLETGADTIQTWTIAPLQMIASVAPSSASADSVNSSGSQSIAYCENQLYIYDAVTSDKLALVASTGEAIPCPVNDIAWSSNGLLAIAEVDGDISIWVTPFHITNGSIVGNIWQDTNHDGLQTGEEANALSGVTVNLLDSSSTLVQTTGTDENGSYSFTVEPGTYTVEILPPADYTLSPANQGSDDTIDSDFDPVTSRTEPVTLAAGESVDLDAGLYAKPATVGGRVWLDSNQNGLQDTDETAGVAEVTVSLLDSNNAVLQITSTDANGLYSFTAEPGTYAVEIAFSGYSLSLMDQGGDDTLDSDFDPATNRTSPITVVAEETADLDAGLYVPAPACSVAPDTPGIYTVSDARWYLRFSNTSGVPEIDFLYGLPNDVAVAGDWNGDTIDTIGVYRDGTLYYLRNSNDEGYADLSFPFGLPGDIPIIGDWNGSGTDTIGVYRPSDGNWFLNNSNDSGDADLVFPFGLPGDIPVTGDWDGDGDDTIGLYRPSDGNWYLRNENSAGFAEVVLHFDIGNNQPLTGDWNGDCQDTIGMYRASDTTWLIKNSLLAGDPDLIFTYGLPGGIAITGKWE